MNNVAKNLIARQEKLNNKDCTPPNPVCVIIDLDQLPDPQPSTNGKWMETCLYTLTNADRAILLSPVGWLNDNLIIAAQNLLKKQSSMPGFQDTCLGQSLGFEIQRGEFIQILHDGHGHWLMISGAITENGAQEIHVFDSMYPTVGTYTKKQIASIVSASKNIELKMMNVQLQNGGCDCGLFAIAFATALANAIESGNCFFKQDLMRTHLYKCLMEEKMTMFPLKPRRTNRLVKSEDTIELFCACRMPEIPPMVEYYKCNNWYPVSCVSVPQKALDDSSIEWICQNC